MFRGYAALDGQELFNTSRLISHMRPTVPVKDGEVASIMSCACDIRIPYDDSWTGLQTALGDGPYVITDAPWYNAARPESAEFAGIWLMSIDGMESTPIQRDVTESICAGGVAGRARDTTRTLSFSALVVACTNAGMDYGKDWLSCILRSSGVRTGVDLSYWKSHPEDTAADPESLQRFMYGLVLTKALTVADLLGKGGGNQHRQASICRVEWEMVATQPYAYGLPTIAPVNWDSTTTESITWAHAPDCEDTGACDLPTIYNADCIPPDVKIDHSVIPQCGGCLPVCSIERRVWQLPTVVSSCDTSVINIRVTNNDADPLNVNFYFRPCGSTDICDKTSPLTVAGLMQDYTAVADSVTGRPYVEVGSIAHRQVGIVSTPTGAPWRPVLLESVLCWELVAEATPGADFTTIIELRDRDS